MKWTTGCAAAAIAIIFFAINISEGISSSLTGIVSDPSGAAIQGANITITNTDTGASIRTVTNTTLNTAGIYHTKDKTVVNTSGIYYAEGLPGGNYSVTVEAEQYSKTVKRNVYLLPEQQGRVDLVVKLADGKTDVVEIDADGELNKSNSLTLHEREKLTIILIGTIESIVQGAVIVKMEDDRKFKISNICSLISESSPRLTVGGDFDFCTRLKDFNQFQNSDTVRITHIRDPQIIGLVAIAKGSSGNREIIQPLVANETSPKMPPLLQLNLKADLVVIGKIIDTKLSADYLDYTIEIERTIAAVWNQEQVSKYVGQRIRLRAEHRDPVPIALFPNGRYLLWLKLERPSDESYLGDASSDYYAPVSFAGIGFNRAGAICLDQLKIILPEDRYKEMRRRLGADPDERNALIMQEEYGTQYPEQIVNFASKSAQMILIGKGNEQDFAKSQSQGQEYETIEGWLLKLGVKAKRFRFASNSH